MKFDHDLITYGDDGEISRESFIAIRNAWFGAYHVALKKTIANDDLNQEVQRLKSIIAGKDKQLRSLRSKLAHRNKTIETIGK